MKIYVASPQILQSSVEIRTINEGDDLRIACTCVRCKPLLHYSWEGPGIWSTSNHSALNRSNVEITPPDLEIDENFIDYTLEIFNATQDNEGIYKCILKNEFNQAVEAVDGLDTLEVYIEVLVQPKIDELTMINDTMSTNSIVNSVLAGTTAYIKCIVRGHPQPQIHWTKDGDTVIDDSRM